jgi:hypothetical protein
MLDIKRWIVIAVLRNWEQFQICSVFFIHPVYAIWQEWNLRPSTLTNWATESSCRTNFIGTYQDFGYLTRAAGLIAFFGTTHAWIPFNI